MKRHLSKADLGRLLVEQRRGGEQDDENPAFGDTAHQSLCVSARLLEVVQLVIKALVKPELESAVRDIRDGVSRVISEMEREGGAAMSEELRQYLTFETSRDAAWKVLSYEDLYFARYTPIPLVPEKGTAARKWWDQWKAACKRAKRKKETP